MGMSLALSSIRLDPLQNSIAQLLGGANLSLRDLTHSAIPVMAAPGTTGTFTRATASSWPNKDGYMVTGVAGEIGFVGAQRVHNLNLTTSEDWNNAAWIRNSCAVTPNSIANPVNGAVTANLIVPANASADPLVRRINSTYGFIIGHTYVLSGYAKMKELRYINIAASGDTLGLPSYLYRRGVFDLQTGTVASSPTGGTAWIEDVGNGWYRCSIRIVPAATSVLAYWTLQIPDQAAPTTTTTWTPNGTDGVYGFGAQLEDVTAQTTQTAGEYVSVGVESAPYYHGSFVDGVKCFPTDISGNPIPSTTMLGYQAQGARTNLCLQSNAFTTTWTNSGAAPTQNVVGPDGATSAWTLTDSGGAATAYITQAITLTAASHTFSIFVKKTSGATTFPLIQATTGTTICSVTVDTNNGVATAWTAYTGFTAVGTATCSSYNSNYWRVQATFTGTAASWSFYIVPAGTTNATQSTGLPDATAQGSAVFYGAQVELGSFASSYIATTTIAVARNKDEESVSTSGNIAAAAGSIYLEYTPTHAPSGTVAFWGTYVDADNYTAILHDATNLIFRKRIAGVNYDATIANAFVAWTTYKACATWGTAGTSITLNGTEGTPHANTTAAQIGSTMQWGADGNSLQQPFAYLRNCRGWLRQLSASERVVVTA